MKNNLVIARGMRGLGWPRKIINIAERIHYDAERHDVPSCIISLAVTEEN